MRYRAIPDNFDLPSYISKDISFNLIGENTLEGGGCEDLWISISLPGIKRKIVIALLYRQPNNDPLTFFETLDKKIKSTKNCDMYLVGDMNLNILSEHRRTIANEYLSMLAGNGLFPLITKSSRITQESATLIDHIFTSAMANPTFPGIILSDISGHFFYVWRYSIEATNWSGKTIQISFQKY